jgi:signal transduction histidine kinase
VTEQAWHLFKRHWFALLLAAAIVENAVELIVRRNSDGAPTTSLWITVPLLAVMIVPLFWWRRFPFGAPAAVFVIGATESFVDGRLVTFTLATFLSVLAAVFLFGILEDRRQSVAGLGIALGAAGVVTLNDPTQSWSDFAGAVLLFSISWLAGFAIGRKLEQASAAQERADRLEREQEAEARAAVAEERARIARELHDVVAHAMSVMVVQAGAARRVLDEDPQAAKAAIARIETTGRDGMAEMRRLIGILKEDAAEAERTPQPGLADLDGLLETVRASGVAVELVTEGEPRALSSGADLTAFRVVQEALTNVMKHAGRANARVLLRWLDDALEIEVADDGRGPTAAAPGGQGLIGMRERVALFDGTLTSGARPGGGFELRAIVPIEQGGAS